MNDIDDSNLKEVGFHDRTKLVMYLHQANEAREWMAYLSKKVNEFVETHMKFHDPFKKLCAMALPSPWKGDAFIGRN